MWGRLLIQPPSPVRLPGGGDPWCPSTGFQGVHLVFSAGVDFSPPGVSPPWPTGQAPFLLPLIHLWSPPFFCPEIARGIRCDLCVVYAHLLTFSYSSFPSDVVSTSFCYIMTRKQTVDIYFPVDGGLRACVLSCISHV